MYYIYTCMEIKVYARIDSEGFQFVSCFPSSKELCVSINREFVCSRRIILCIPLSPNLAKKLHFMEKFCENVGYCVNLKLNVLYWYLLSTRTSKEAADVHFHDMVCEQCFQPWHSGNKSFGFTIKVNT